MTRVNMPPGVHEPWARVLDAGNSERCPYVFSCEHASNYMGNIELTQAEAQIIDSHWGWDIGIADLTKALVVETQSLGVFSTYSRLLLDTNRSLNSNTLIVTEAEKTPLSFNQGLTPADHQNRIETLHKGYHEVLNQSLCHGIAHGAHLFLSMHSFTPVFDGHHREVEIGVLFDRYDDLAQLACQTLGKLGYASKLNEPYSGLTGELMYAATRHGGDCQIPYLEFEVRQDLIDSTAKRARVTQALLKTLQALSNKLNK